MEDYVMKLTHAQEEFLKFAAKTQLYVALAVLTLVTYGVATKLPLEMNWMFALGLFVVSEVVAVYYMLKLNRRFDIWTSKHDHESSDK